MKRGFNSSLLRSRLKLKHLQSELALKRSHPQAVFQIESAGVAPGRLRNHAAKLLTAGAAATSLLFSPPQSLPAKASLSATSLSSTFNPQQLNRLLAQRLADILPPVGSSLNSSQETRVTEALRDLYGLQATPELEGNRLNTSYGLIGAEQHLPRYPGDTADQHSAFISSGITPNRGAWGYFAPSKSTLTPDLIEKEKYYVAVQTLYLPDWNTRLTYLRDWYRYRKVVVVNAGTGKTVVAVVADSGPASWTGKQFGGSPEIMAYLSLNTSMQKGKVVLFFVDDPQELVPLGPLEYNLERPPLLTPA